MSGDRKRKEWIRVASSPPAERAELEGLRDRLQRAGIEVELGPEGETEGTRELCVHPEDLDIARQIWLGSEEIYK